MRPLLQRYLTDDRGDSELVQLFLDTQGYILESHRCDEVWHFLIRFTSTDALALRQKLAFLPWRITNLRTLRDRAQRPKETPVVAAGLSFQGCQRLRIPMSRFNLDFQPFRRRAAGVTRQGVDGWQDHWRQEPGYDAIVVCAAESVNLLQNAGSSLTDHLRGLAVVEVEPGHVKREPSPPQGRRGRAIEHFGFADGISQPAMLDHANPQPPADRNPSARGSLVLVDEAIPGQPDTGYGSYMAFLKIEQHIVQFEAAVRELAKRIHGTQEPDMAQCEQAATLIIGRRRCGCPLAGTPTAGACPDPNNFGRKDDPSGATWPFASHTSKMNARTGEGTLARILRRGVTYEKDGHKGLLFASFQSSYSRQFEEHLRAWANIGWHPFDHTGMDPIIGFAQPANQTFPGMDGTISIANLTKVLGGEYFYFPSISALSNLPERPFD